MAGFVVTRQVVDQRVGSSVLRLRDAFEDVEKAAVWLAATPDVDLEALGYTSGEVAVIKSAFLALDKLRRVAYAQDVQEQPDNFFHFGNQLTGVQ